MHTYHTLQVLGHTWEGFQSAYDYTIPSTQSASSLTPLTARTLAADFASLDDFQVVRHTHTRMSDGRHTVKQHIETIIKKWQSPISAELYADHHPGYSEEI